MTYLNLSALKAGGAQQQKSLNLSQKDIMRFKITKSESKRDIISDSSPHRFQKDPYANKLHKKLNLSSAFKESRPKRSTIDLGDHYQLNNAQRQQYPTCAS